MTSSRQERLDAVYRDVATCKELRPTAPLPIVIAQKKWAHFLLRWLSYLSRKKSRRRRPLAAIYIQWYWTPEEDGTFLIDKSTEEGRGSTNRAGACNWN